MRPRAIAFLLVTGSLSACGDSAAPGPIASSVSITSAIDTLLAVGRTAQLTGTARDAGGAAVTVQLSWSSSNTATATVDAAGLVTTLAAGNTTITATGGGVSGNLRLRVVPAELAVVGTLASDVFGASLVNGLSGTAKTALQAAIAACGSGATSGNIVSINSCLASARAQVASATDPTDRVLLAVLSLYADEIERRLKLQ